MFTALALIVCPAIALPQLDEQDELQVKIASVEALIEGKGDRKKTGQALFQLGNLQSDDAANALAAFLDDLNTMDRGSAILALGMCHNEVAINHLREIVLNSKQLPDRDTASRVLASEGDGEWVLKQFAKEKNAMAAASMLRAVIDSELNNIDKQILSAAKHKSASVRAAAFYGIAQREIVAGIKLVEKGLKDSSLVSRVEAAIACGLIGNEKSYKLLIKILRDSRNQNFMLVVGDALRNANTEEKISLIAAAATKERDEAVQIILVDALASSAKHDPQAATKALIKLVGKKNDDVRRHAIRGLAAARPEGVMEILLEQLSDGEHTIRNEAAWALSQLSDFSEEIENTLISMCQDLRPELRLNACLALGGGSMEASINSLIRALVDESWAVRSASVEALTRRRNVKCMQALIDLLENESSRVRVELAEALARLSGQDFQENANSWHRWLEDQGADYDLPPLDMATESLALIRKKRKDEEDYTSYHGIPITAGNTIFILDISGSMSELLSGEHANGETRFKVFSDALKQTISRMPSSTRFNLVLFSSGSQLWKPESLSPSEDNIVASHVYLDKALPFGGTNIYDALLTAMSVPEAQNIFLMTDGEPSVGMTDTRRIVTDITRRNRDLRINIHTIAGGQAKAQFLADLAAANGGQAVDLREL